MRCWALVGRGRIAFDLLNHGATLPSWVSLQFRTIVKMQNKCEILT